MRMGLRQKIILSLFVTLALPMFTGTVAGVNLETGPNAWSVANLLLALLIPFSVCAFILATIISESILKPLQELNKATDKMKDGSFDFVLTYKKNDEMGDFCAAFDAMREQLKVSLEKQAALDHSRKELIASISHDLRTPMSSIKGYVEGLQDGIVHDREKFNRYIAVIKNKTENLDHLIESLFQFSQLDINHQEEDRCLLDSKEMLESIVAPLELEFADHAVKLDVIRPFPSAPIFVNTSQIAQVFDNLISNAKRYIGEKGRIVIEARMDHDAVKISIIDNGIGISEEDLPHVFDHFYRAEKSRSRNYGGAGLGLAICKKIIENHGGKIWVESTKKIATTFHFTLPILK